MEDEIFLETDGNPGADPICHHREEILKDGVKLVATADGKDEL